MLITYCIPSYQRFERACLAVDSCLGEIEAGASAEVIVIDDASGDGCGKKLLQRYKSQRHVKVIARKKNLGLIANWNEALNLAKGEWVQFLGDDDRVAKGSAALVADKLKANPGLSMLFSATRLIDAQGNLAELNRPLAGREGLWDGDELWFWMLTYFSNVTMCSVLFNKKRLLEVGGFREEAWYAADGDMFLRIMAGSKIYYLDQPLALNGWDGSNLQGTMKGKRILAALESVVNEANLPAAISDNAATRKSLKAFLIGRHAADSTLRWRLAGEKEKADYMESVVIQSQIGLAEGVWQRPMNFARWSKSSLVGAGLLFMARVVWYIRRSSGYLLLPPKECKKMLCELIRKQV